MFTKLKLFKPMNSFRNQTHAWLKSRYQNASLIQSLNSVVSVMYTSMIVFAALQNFLPLMCLILKR